MHMCVFSFDVCLEVISRALYLFFLAKLSPLSFPFPTDGVCHGGTLSLAVRWRWAFPWKDVDATLWTISSYYSGFLLEFPQWNPITEREHHTDLYSARWEELWNHLDLIGVTADQGFSPAFQKYGGMWLAGVEVDANIWLSTRLRELSVSLLFV